MPDDHPFARAVVAIGRVSEWADPVPMAAALRGAAFLSAGGKIAKMDADDPRLSEFRHLWTTDKDQYVLLGGTPIRVVGQEVTVLVIDDFDDEIAAEVIRLMAAAGVKTVNSIEEAKATAKRGMDSKNSG